MMTRDSRTEPSFAALIIVTAVGPFCTDTYLAALPELQAALGTSASASQLTITACIVGLAVGMLLGGSISDGIGRRRLLLWSCAAFFVASLACLVAPEIITLIVMRLVQGAASGVAASIARAIVSDRYSGLDAAKKYGTLGAIGLLAPVTAPAIGGVLVLLWEWRAVFVLMAAIGLLMLVFVAWGIPETSGAQPRAESATVRALLRRGGELLTIRGFRNAVIIQCVATAGFFVYIGGSSYVLQQGLGASPVLYSTIFAVNAAGMAVASLVFRLSITRFSPEVLRAIGLVASFAGATALLIVSIVAGGRPSIVLVWGLLLVVVGAMGLTQPASTVISQEHGRRSPGTAASLQGGLAFLVGAATTPLTGLVDARSVTVMALLMASLFLVAVVLLTSSGKRRRFDRS